MASRRFVNDVAVEPELLDRATNICLALPEATADDRHPPHRGFLVGTKNFAWFVVDEHGDGRIGLGVRAAPGENEELVATDPERFGLPKYVARHGWVTYYLDLPGRPVDWDDVAELVQASYIIQAPTRLAVSWTTENRRSVATGRAVAGRFRCPVRRGRAAQASSTGSGETKVTLGLGAARRTRAGNLAMDHLAARTSCTRETARSNGGLTKTTARWTPRSSR